MSYLFLISGLVLLVFSGDFLVKGSVSLAGHFRLSKLVVGIVIVSIGTSAPELVVSVNAALSGHPDISLGNVIGSNISNIALVLGLTAIIMPVQAKRKGVVIDWAMMMFASVLLYLFALDDVISFWDGSLFLLLLFIYITYSIYISRRENKKLGQVHVKPTQTLIVSLMFVGGAAIGLVVGADLLVRGAIGVARQFQVDERVISVSVVAFGTSVPELATSIMAAIRKEIDIFIGNIIGSNIFNILAILGITGLIKNIEVNPSTLSNDLIWMLGISFLLFLFLLPLRKRTIGRWQGMVFVSLYSVFIFLVFAA
ncbi:MAG: calcium/sodium antiporter [Bacteroidales bacterium]|jgi:cation:H+ antiporter